MKVVILAGGLGTRLAEETEIIPKPMVEIGGRPILWHIMQCYAHYGFKEFFVALGYKGEIIKRFFLDYQALNGSIAIDLSSGKLDVHERESEDWKVNLIERENPHWEDLYPSLPGVRPPLIKGGR